MVEMGWDPEGEGITFLRKSLLRLTFCRLDVFLNTEGLAGVERGVGGVEAPSNTGVLSPVLVSSFCRASGGDSGSEASVAVSVSCFWKSYRIRFTHLFRMYRYI